MLLVRAVITGFGLACGAALFKKHVAKRLGLEEATPEAKKPDDVGTNPGLQHSGV